MPKKDLIRLPVKGRRPLSFAVSDLPDGTRKYILQQDITGYTDVAINAAKIKGDAFIDPTIAACLPISVENPALAYDADNDEFYVRSKSTSRPIYADLRTLVGAAISKTNPLNVRLGDGTDNIPFPTALDTGAFKVREQNPITGFATQTTLALIAGYVDGLETLLGGGLPAALDTGAVKTREQNPITGFATAANQIIIQAYIDGIETLLGGGLPAALDNLALKIREQNWPIPTTYTGYNVTMTDADHEYSQAIAGTVRAYEIATRDRTAFRFSFATGKVATPTAPYKTIAAKEVYWKEGVKMTDPTFYFASASAGKVIELDVWT